mgnify:CR=1 FL=1
MKKIFALLLAVVMTLGLLAGCGTAAETPDTEAPATEAPVAEEPAAEPTAKKIDTLKVAFVPSREPQEIITVTEPLKEMLKNELAALGYEVGEVEITVGTTYEAVGEGLEAGTIDVGLIPGGTYVLYDDGAEVILTATRDGLSKDSDNAKDWNEWNKSAPDPDALEAFVEKFAEHYRGEIEFYEFWNEPDLDFWRGTAEEYLECLKRVRRALKKSDPEAKLITGGFAYVGARSKPGFQEQVLAEGQDDFDFHGYHQHGDFSEYERVLEGPLARMRRVLRSPKPIFFTETGFYISNGNYLQQAENVVRKIVHAWATGARGYLWFNMRDDGFLPGYCEHNYGLVTNDWYPKEGFAAFNTLNLLLGQARYGGVLLRNPRTTAHWFRRDDGQAVVFWKSGRGTVEEPLTLLTDAAEAEFVDLFGNATPLKLSAGRLTVPVPEHPGYLLVGDALGKPFGQRGLAHARFAHKAGVVLLAAA